MGPPGGSACRRPSDESAASARMSKWGQPYSKRVRKEPCDRTSGRFFPDSFCAEPSGEVHAVRQTGLFRGMPRGREAANRVGFGACRGGCAVCRSVFRVLYIRRTGRMAVVVSCFGSEAPPAAVVRDGPKASSACGKAAKTVRGNAAGCPVRMRMYPVGKPDGPETLPWVVRRRVAE